MDPSKCPSLKKCPLEYTFEEIVYNDVKFPGVCFECLMQKSVNTLVKADKEYHKRKARHEIENPDRALQEIKDRIYNPREYEGSDEIW